MEALKQMFIRTPLERPLQQLRHLAGFRKRRKHPELAEIYIENDRIDAMLDRVVKADTNCLDIGCHLGSFLSQLLRLAPKGKHAAFEALPDKAARLKKKFSDVEIHHCAVSDKPGEITFYRNITRSGFSGMNVHANETDKIEEVKVRCMPVDEMVPADRPIGFIKVDVEGAELSVFKGAAQTIARGKPYILFECTIDGLKSAGSTPREIFDYIEQSLGYRVYLLKDWLADGQPLAFERFEKSMRYPFQAYNFLAAPAK
ncbi:FkbM family methyltransferase [Humisphaera borealis]|uniref:FkbM family methyltransferase n=1 Tax=Humisphaera borealis TaxID=2807512 RepID=A0A7M2X2Z2_9BACT|nr:FkbM family methyltransferase [Humisphaera borealis]QOV91130.1 FkbM family methyltransferase [Humisphaera borealis]